MSLDVLYFHSCGIVGIMMVMINWLTFFFFAVYKLYVECELFFFVFCMAFEEKKNFNT